MTRNSSGTWTVIAQRCIMNPISQLTTEITFPKKGPAMNIFQRLKYEDTLTTSERQFATFIEKHTDMVLNGNLRDVVKAAYVSKSA